MNTRRETTGRLVRKAAAHIYNSARGTRGPPQPQHDGPSTACKQWSVLATAGGLTLAETGSRPISLKTCWQPAAEPGQIRVGPWIPRSSDDVRLDAHTVCDCATTHTPAAGFRPDLMKSSWPALCRACRSRSYGRSLVRAQPRTLGGGCGHNRAQGGQGACKTGSNFVMRSSDDSAAGCHRMDPVGSV
jgi:hypothetical protein